MTLSLLYLAFRALLGELVRSRRGVDVKNLELLVLRHELEVLRYQVARRKLARLIVGCLGRRPAICHARRAARVWSLRGRCCGGIGRFCAGGAAAARRAWTP
jgi:hypothetical protein